MRPLVTRARSRARNWLMLIEGLNSESSGRSSAVRSSIAGFMIFLLGGGYTPGILYEYQKKGLTEFAFYKCMILKEMFLVQQYRLMGKKALKNEKREQAPALPNAVIYSDKCSTD